MSGACYSALELGRWQGDPADPAEDPVPPGPGLLGSQEAARDEPVKPISLLRPFFPKLPGTEARKGYS